MKTPLGFFDSNASGLLRNRLDGGAGETETLLAHNLADIVGTAAMFIAMIVLMIVFDWRMKCYTVEEITAALTAAGFSDVSSDHYNGKPWITVVAKK